MGFRCPASPSCVRSGAGMRRSGGKEPWAERQRLQRLKEKDPGCILGSFGKDQGLALRALGSGAGTGAGGLRARSLSPQQAPRQH